jgi:hypothetical protein
MTLENIIKSIPITESELIVNSIEILDQQKQ